MTVPQATFSAADLVPLTGQIGVNLTWLVPGVVGGSEEYSVRLLTGLGPDLPTGVRIRLYGRPDLFETYPELACGFEIVAMPEAPSSKLRRVILEQTWLRDMSQDDDLVHHMGGTIPLRSAHPKQRQMVTIHDLQPLDMPEYFGRIKRHWLGWMIPRAAKRVDQIVCPSRFTAQRITAMLSVPEDRISVVCHGFEPPPEPDDSSMRTIADRRSAEPTQTRLNGVPFLLYPAIAYRHKRHSDIVRALAAVRGQNPSSGIDRLHLVLTGRRGPESESLERQIADTGLSDRVHVLGRVPEDELDWLYRNAVTLVFPSEYEGFGNPCLEAMSRGCPVVASSSGALPEVVGDAGLMFPPGNINAMIDCIDRLISEPETAAGLITAGYEQAGRFTPAIASRELWSVYRELLNTAPGDLHRRP